MGGKEEEEGGEGGNDKSRNANSRDGAKEFSVGVD